MIADDVRRPYPHPYEVTVRGERPAPPPPAADDHYADDDRYTPAPFADDRYADDLAGPTPAPSSGHASARTTAAERTVHRLHHIRLVSDQAISVIDQVLEHAS
ncbi:hypothetical protein [Nonomuraea lactucae]|uniref:hypothetical protein n=1 Tax=Nonomuraea lactucae TaxID=2249762 RepID=UPI000DE224CF|nr:hypothetical protein [Nonomuraea lactucae]